MGDLPKLTYLDMGWIVHEGDEVGDPIAVLTQDDKGFIYDELGEAMAAAPDMLEALQCVQRLINEALPKFDWGRSALDGNAISLLNEVPIRVAAAIAKASPSPKSESSQ